MHCKGRRVIDRRGFLILRRQKMRMRQKRRRGSMGRRSLAVASAITALLCTTRLTSHDRYRVRALNTHSYTIPQLQYTIQMTLDTLPQELLVDVFDGFETPRLKYDALLSTMQTKTALYHRLLPILYGEIDFSDVNMYV